MAGIARAVDSAVSAYRGIRDLESESAFKEEVAKPGADLNDPDEQRKLISIHPQLAYGLFDRQKELFEAKQLQVNLGYRHLHQADEAAWDAYRGALKAAPDDLSGAKSAANDVWQQWRQIGTDRIGERFVNNVMPSIWTLDGALQRAPQYDRLFGAMKDARYVRIPDGQGGYSVQEKSMLPEDWAQYEKENPDHITSKLAAGKDAPAGAFRRLSLDEVKAAGLRPGTVAEVDPESNKLHVVQEPPRPEAGVAFAQRLADLGLKNARGTITPEEKGEYLGLREDAQVPVAFVDPQTGKPGVRPKFDLTEHDKFFAQYKAPGTTEAGAPGGVPAPRQAVAERTPLSEGDRGAILQRDQTLQALGRINDNASKAGLLAGRVTQLQNVVGASYAAGDLKADLAQIRLSVRGLAKGQGQISDQEQKLLDDMTPEVTDGGPVFSAKVNRLQGYVAAIQAGDLNYLKANGTLITRELEEAHQRATQAGAVAAQGNRPGAAPVAVAPPKIGRDDTDFTKFNDAQLKAITPAQFDTMTNAQLAAFTNESAKRRKARGTVER